MLAWSVCTCRHPQTHQEWKGGTPIIDNPLFQGIVQNPTDLDRRLVFSDWLEDHDELPRAEFVRLQCASSDSTFTFQRRDSLETNATPREQELFATHRRHWNVPLFRFLLDGPMRTVLRQRRLRKICEWYYRRGFVEQLAVNTRVFLDHHETMIQLGPILHLHVRRIEAPLEEFLACPALAQIQSLHLASHVLPYQTLASLADCPHLEQLTDLFVNPWLFPNEEATLLDRFTRSPYLKNLKRVWPFNVTAEELALTEPAPDPVPEPKRPWWQFWRS